MIRIGALGDVLLTRRLTCSLHRRGFRTTLMAPARHATLLLADPWIDGIVDSEAPASAAAFGGSWPDSAGRFDVAIVISDSRDLLKAAASAAPTLIQISPTPAPTGVRVSSQWAEAARVVCDPFTGEMPPLETRAQDAAARGATLIHPGSGSPRKNWPIERFVELSRRLQSAGHEVVWIRGPAEMGHPDAWDGRRLDRPSLQSLAATLAASRLFVGNDSGVSHLAAAVGALTLALFGPTDDAAWRPDGPRVRVVRSASGALEDISVGAVLEAADRAHQTE